MADIIVKIAINPEGGGQIGSVSTSYSQLLNNVSIKADDTGVFDVLTDDSFQGTEMLAFNKGVLHFNKAGFLSNRKDGEAGRLQSSKQPRQYIWGRTDDNGYALDKDGNIVELVITIESTGSDVNFDSIVVVGDSVSKQFPVEVYLDDSVEPIYSDDAKWAIKFEENKSSHTIRIVRWNRPNYNAVLNAIRVMYKYINIDNRALQSVSSLSESSSDVSTINYGTIANSGSINIVDANGEIEDLIRDEILPNSDVDIEIQYNGNVIQHHISNDTDYKSDTKEFNLSLTNKIKDLDILTYKGYPYPNESRFLYDLLFDVMKSLNSGILDEDDFKKMTSNKCFASSIALDILIDEEIFIYDYLKQIKIPYPVIESGKTYREVIDNICTVAQLRMFVNDKNEYEFVSARPLFLSTDNPLLVESKTVMQEPINDVVLKNKFKAVNISEYKVNDEFDYNTVVGTSNIVLNDFLSSKESMIADYETDYDSRAAGSYRGLVAITYIISHLYYTSRSVTINRKDINNLNQIINIYNTIKKDGHYTYNNTYAYSSSPATAVAKTKDGITIQSLSNDVTAEEEIRTSIISSEDTVEHTESFGVYSATSKIELKDNNDSIIEEMIFNEDDTITIKYLVLCGKKITKLYGGTNWYDSVNIVVPDATNYDLTVTLTGTVEYYRPIELNVSFYGDKRTISFNEVSASSENIESEKYKTSINSNYLIQSGTTFNDLKVSEIIKKTIINDYNKGIESKQLDIICYNMKDESENIIINKNDGEILNPVNIIYLKRDNYPDGSQKYWRVFSRNFIYDGEPYLKTIAEETIRNKTTGLFDSNGYTVKSWDKMVEDGDVVIENNTIISTNADSISGSLIIPRSISTIGEKAFYHCTELTAIFIPNSIQSIYKDAFSGCSNLAKVESPSVFDWCSIYFESQTSNPLYYSKNLYIKGALLKNLQFPKGVNYINSYSFINCESIKSLSFENDSLVSSLGTTIGRYAFYNCINLENVDKLPKDIIAIMEYAFFRCSKLKNITFDSDSQLTTIKTWAFSGCSELTNITFPYYTRKIEMAAFSDTGLSLAYFKNTSGWSVTISDSATSIDVTNASTNATNLKSTYVDYEWTKS